MAILGIRVFFDADVIIAGSASQIGASFLLLQLCELGLLNGLTSKQVVEECKRNIRKKLPKAEPFFKQIIKYSLEIVPNPKSKVIKTYQQEAHLKDVPILAAALETKAQYLLTFNISHYWPDADRNILICKPGDLLQKIRQQLTQLTK